MKKTSPSNEAPRPLLILGRVTNAADLALRRILHAKKRGQALVIVDYQGSMASHLTERNKGNLHKGPLLWCDLANRRRPTALFRFNRTSGMKPALRTFLSSCVQFVAATVSEPTINAVVELAYRLVDQGTIGLAALVQSLRRSETSHVLRRDGSAGDELDRLIEVLEWALRFPAVWCLSEGNNFVDLNRYLTMGGTVWVELPGSHFERVEHQLVSWMVDAALMDALLSRDRDRPSGAPARPAPILMYAFPAVCPLPLAGGVANARQVGVFQFSSTYPLSAAARHWLDIGADCWIAGDVGELPATSKTSWLTDAERARLRELKPGQVWVRSGFDQKAVTALVRPPEARDSLAHTYRRLALKRLRLTPVKQFSTAVANHEARVPQNTDLYRKLCTKEVLYAGWFRVKGHNKHSHGNDGITIEQFGARLDVELDRLAQELAQGRYRCRALRTVRLPKPDGDFRVIKVACVRDRVVQAGCLHLIEPLFDARFSRSSFAYRPGRGAHHAVALARAAIRAGKHWVVTADIKKCFDTVDHEILLRLVGDVIGDRDLLQLIREWLVADVIDFMDVIPSELGVPQGEAISPLLANIYLDPLDKEFEQSGLTFVRYADDYLVLCDTEAQAHAALRQMGEFLHGALRMALKPAKTQYSRVTHDLEQGIGFLGFQIALADVRIPPARIEVALQSVAEVLETVAAPSSTTMEKYDAIMLMNARVRGFRNYFMIDDAPAIRVQLTGMDSAVDALAQLQLPADASVALAWDSRERFVTSTDMTARQLQTAAEVALLTGGYPTDRLLNAPDVATSERAPMPALASTAAAETEAASPGSGGPGEGEKGDPDVLVIDGKLHVMTSGCYVTVSADDLVVRRRKNEIFRKPFSELSMVYLEGKGIALSAELTMRLCEKDVPIVFTPLIGIPSAIAQPVHSTRSNLRQQQVLRRNDPDILKVGINMLAAKVANQASVLKYFARYRKRTDDATYVELTRGADDVRTIAETLGGFDPSAVASRASAMGHEGRAAAKYWSSFAKLVPAQLSFPGRHTRHATDPVNSAVNYVYGLLYGEVWRAVVRCGLDPYFGIIHGTERDQGSLIFDLIEEYRAPFGDRIVLGLLGRGFDIAMDKEGRLRAACRQKLVHAFYKQWNRFIRWRGTMRPPADILEQQVSSLKSAYLGNDEYRPFRFRW